MKSLPNVFKTSLHLEKDILHDGNCPRGFAQKEASKAPLVCNAG
jgi:hypothetical protein